MASQPSDTFDALLCFDANLPKLGKCEDNCGCKKSILCIHRFNSKVQVEHCNTKAFGGWSDLSIFTHFLGCIIAGIARSSINPGRYVFIILTKDRNFIYDVKKEWEKTDADARLDLVFSGNSISCGGLIVFIQQIDCPNYGHSKADDLRCAFYKVNSFLSENSKA